jgi:uncharacterized protein YndB with AHSA1/START domain
MSDEAVRAKTGRTWAEWFRLLDAEGCRKMNHKEIVAVVGRKYAVGPWWQQMVTVEYERARGLREKHERPDGYQVSRSKTLAAAPDRVFRAWNDHKARNRWLADPAVTVRKATPARSLRITWVDGRTSVEVMLYPKGADKTQVTVQHSKLASAAAAERMKAYWGVQLERLAEMLSGG